MRIQEEEQVINMEKKSTLSVDNESVERNCSQLLFQRLITAGTNIGDLEEVFDITYVVTLLRFSKQMKCCWKPIGPHWSMPCGEKSQKWNTRWPRILSTCLTAAVFYTGYSGELAKCAKTFFVAAHKMRPGDMVKPP